MGGAVAGRTRFNVGDNLDLLTGEVMRRGNVNDSRIQRVRTVTYQYENRSGVGTGEVDWTAAGPPPVRSRSVNLTYRRMAGTSATRFLPDPRDPSVGLHSATTRLDRGNLGEIRVGAPTIRHGRQDRLQPARAGGRSYSSTTLLQSQTLRRGR